MDQFRKMILNDVAQATKALSAAMEELQNEQEPNYAIIGKTLSIASHQMLIASERADSHVPYAIQWAMLKKRDGW
jgi:predicted lipoprotein